MRLGPAAAVPRVPPRRARGPGLLRALAAALLLALVLAPSARADRQIDLEGLMPGAAVLLIDGERKMLREGQSFQGVTLIAAYSSTASLEVEGRQMVLGLSRRVGANYQPPAEQRVTIQRDARLQYQTSAQINGRRVQVLVDTGANMVAMNEAQAGRLGLDLDRAQPATVETASGLARAWVVKLHAVDVGGIEVNNVAATVISGQYPALVLLGMTYLKHVKMEEKQGVMTLSRVR